MQFGSVVARVRQQQAKQGGRKRECCRLRSERRDNQKERGIAALGLLGPPRRRAKAAQKRSRLLPAVRRRRGVGARERGEFGLSRFLKGIWT